MALALLAWAIGGTVTSTIETCRVRTISLLIAICVTLMASALGAPATQASPAPIPAENGMVVETIPVNDMPIDAAVQQARLLTSPGGVVLGDDRIHRIIVKDLPENIEKIRAHLGHVDIALPMVRLQISFDARARDRNRQMGITGVNGGAVVSEPGYRACQSTHPTAVHGAATITGTAYDNRGGVTDQGDMSVVTMSGSEGVISVGENVPIACFAFFRDYALSRGYIASTVVFQNVSTGFGVVPTVLGGDEIKLKVYPRLSYQSPLGPDVIRFMEAATEVRAHNGQSVQIAASSDDTQGVFGRILSSGSFSSVQSGSFVVTPTVMRDPYAQ